MKRFLRYIAYRELYRSIRKLLESAENTAQNDTARSQSASTPTSAEELLDHPEMPADGATVDSPTQLRAVLQQMDPYEFEHFVADLWTRMGWDTDVSSAAGDKGVDVIARQSTPYEQLLLIQAKRYGPNTTVGSPDIQQYASLRQQFDDVDKVLIVTTNEFTQQAEETADQLNVKLINGLELARLIENHEALDLVAEYLDFIHPVSETDADEQTATGKISSQQTSETASDEPPATSESSLSNATDSTTTELPSTGWYTAVWACFGAWIFAVPGVYVVPELLWSVIFLSAWLGLPVAIFQDARSISGITEWPQYTWAYVLGSLIWFVAIPVAGVYLWQRRRVSM